MGAKTGDNLIPSSQAHVLGHAVIPQRLRSLRRARPASPDSVGGPWKRQRTSPGEDAETSEAAIAEMLLGLSHSPRSSGSAQESDVSTEDEEVLLLGSPKRRGGQGRAGHGVRSQLGRRTQELDIRRSEDLDEDVDSENEQAHKQKAAKRLPGRCKCGKRVSASHPPCKSELMLLCERFCERCGRGSEGGEPTRIHLNECAVALGVPRRRLYDITIVYEAAEVVKRTGKLAYVWRGLGHLPELIEQLRREEAAGLPVADRKGNSLLSQDGGERQTTHSLWTLSRKFIRLLLTTKGPIQLSDAAEHLIGEHLPAKRQQTQVTVERRLYDIGSILATLNLINRTYVEGKRQPAFSWNWARTPEAPLPKQATPPAAPAAPADVKSAGSPVLAVRALQLASQEGSRNIAARADCVLGTAAGGSSPPMVNSKVQCVPIKPEGLAVMAGRFPCLTSGLTVPAAASAYLPPLAPLVLPLQVASQLHCGPWMRDGPTQAPALCTPTRAQPLA